MEIEWREGSALELPFDDGAFDLVFCQMGMQFFPDRARAVAEMHRVLAPGGRAVLTTWRGLDRHPFPAALARAVQERVGSPALGMPFVLGDPAVLAVLLQEAGFADVSVEPVEIVADYARPREYVALQIRASAAGIAALQGLPAAELDAIIAAIEQRHDGPGARGDRGRPPALPDARNCGAGNPHSELNRSGVAHAPPRLLAWHAMAAYARRHSTIVSA